MERVKEIVEEGVYHPQDAVTAAAKATAVTGTAGLLISAVQNTLTKQNVSAWGVFTRTGGTIATFGKILSTSYGCLCDSAIRLTNHQPLLEVLLNSSSWRQPISARKMTATTHRLEVLLQDH
jgi:hypothetical protein